MVYGPYYRQRGALTGTPITPEALYGEDIRRPAVRTDDLYERYGEASPYEGAQTANKRAITGMDQSLTSYSSPEVTGFTGTMSEDPNALTTLAFYQGLPGGRAPQGYPSLGRTGDVIASQAVRSALGFLNVPGWLINPNLIARAFVIPLLSQFADEIGLTRSPSDEIFNMADYGYENPGYGYETTPEGYTYTHEAPISAPYGPGSGDPVSGEPGGGFGFPSGYSF